jgi:hypothetical protein
MRKISFIFVIGLIAAFATSTAFGFVGDDKKPKNTGTLTVKTSPVAYPVKVNGQYLGMSGVSDGAAFYLPPGTHKLEVEFPNGKMFSENIQIIKDRKNCVCLKFVESTTERACPYNVRVDGPDRITEGDLITFAAFNAVTGAAVPLNYRWSVSPETAQITSGQGTSAITVDTTNLGGRTVRAELDVWDDVYDKQCRQRNQATTEITTFLRPKPEAVRCDVFESKAFDDDKARFDNCVIQVNSVPDGQLYLIIYQGTDKISMTRNTYDKLSKRTLDYLVKTRGLDPRRISIIKGGRTPLKTTYELWIVPPGAELPLPQ